MSRFMLQCFNRLVLVAVVMSCGRDSWLDSLTSQQESQKKQALHKFIAHGRKVSFTGQSAIDHHALALTGEQEVVGSKREEGTDVISWIAFNVDKMPNITSDLTTAALTFIEQNSDLFKLPIAELKPADHFAVQLTDKITVLNFVRYINNVLVRDAFIEVNFIKTEQGHYRVREIVNRTHGMIPIANKAGSRATFAELLSQTGLDVVLTAERPVIFSKMLGADRYQFLLATEFTVYEQEQDHIYTITLDDENKEILEAYSRTYSADDKTLLRAKVYKRSYLDNMLVDGILPLTRITYGNDQTFSNYDSEVVLPGDVSAAINLESTRVRIFDNDQNQSYRIPFALVKDQTNFIQGNDQQLRALNTYSAVHEINKFARQFLSDAEASYLNTAVAVRINVTGNCNAFYDSPTVSISIFAAGNNCSNLALVNDVVQHEWGHGLDDAVGRTKGITDGAFSEGLSDVVSAFYNDSSNLAPGFLQNNLQGIRQLQNSARYPENRGEVHQEGLIIGGAFWDLRQMLIERYGKTYGSYYAGYLFFRHLLTTDSYLESYQTVLNLDDDDGNPMTKSPHHCLINDAFARHGLAQGENCQDAAPSQYEIDHDLYLGIYKTESSGVTLMASSTDADSIELCFGNKRNCTRNEKVDLQFNKEGIKNNRVIFLAAKPIELQELSEVTLIARNKQKAIIGYRFVKLIKK